MLSFDHSKHHEKGGALGGTRILILCLELGLIWLVYLSWAVAGMMAGGVPVATALIADASTPDQRSRAMGLIGRAFGIGLILGPVIGGVLSRSETDFALPCLVAGILSMLAGLLAAVLPGAAGVDGGPAGAVSEGLPPAGCAAAGLVATGLAAAVSEGLFAAGLPPTAG